MKISLNWMKWYGGQGLDAPIDELVERIGAQLGAVEEVENLGEKYQGVVIAKVVSCVDHPDANRLHVCTIDDGGITKGVKRDENGHVQVVCGAPNVRVGLLVAWLPPGSTVPETIGKEPFVLEARELRGVVSNGMLASSKELALGDSHTGILELDGDAKPGDDFATAYGLDDYVIDIENKMFTHRPDCFGQLGVAREIAGISGQKFTSPDWYLNVLQDTLSQDGESLPLEARNEIPELAPRFVAITMSGLSIKPSPTWLQTYLQRVGIRSINNIVDITNYLMLLTGQPLHAYDYDKVKALSGGTATIVVRQPHENEKITLLNGKTIDPRQEAIMIATDKQLIGIAGVMGGAETEVDDNTKNIILEVANFDMYSIRRTSMTHGLFTDAVTRFNKGQSPLQNDKIAAKAVHEVRELAGGKVAGALIDISQVEGREWVHPPVPVSIEFVNSRLGFNLSANDMATLLNNVEFGILISEDNQSITVTAPFWRTDIETREDVVEEIGRLYGFDKLPVELPVRSIKPATKDPVLELKQRIRENLVKSGANEVLTYSFVHGDLLDKVGQDKKQAFELSNALSPDLQYYRLSLTPSLLDKIHPNIKVGYDQFALFEIGKGHNLQQIGEDGLPAEFEMLDLVYAASDKAKKTGAAFYEAREFLANLVADFGLELEFRPIKAEEEYQVVKPYDHARSAQVFVKGTDMALGMVGEYKQSVRKALKLPKYCAGFGIGITQLLQASKDAKNKYVSLPRFPKVNQDITFKVGANVAFRQLFDFTQGELLKNQPEQTLSTLEPIDIYQRADDAEHKQVTLRLTIANYQRTMTDQEVSRLLDEVAAAAKDKFGAEKV